MSSKQLGDSGQPSFYHETYNDSDHQINRMLEEIQNKVKEKHYQEPPTITSTEQQMSAVPRHLDNQEQLNTTQNNTMVANYAHYMIEYEK